MLKIIGNPLPKIIEKISNQFFSNDYLEGKNLEKNRFYNIELKAIRMNNKIG